MKKQTLYNDMDVNVCYRTASIGGGGSVSGAGGTNAPPQYMMRYEKLDQQEIKDLLVCFLYIVKNLSEGMYWFLNSIK